jgi:prefoldin subunit 5
MAKALFGYMGTGDTRGQEQTRALRRRVSELEAQVEALRAEALETEALHAAVLEADAAAEQEEKALVPAQREELLAL